ncbi:MAG: hypothetical protein ACK57T_19940, partial [Dolichospermum sp.]
SLFPVPCSLFPVPCSLVITTIFNANLLIAKFKLYYNMKCKIWDMRRKSYSCWHKTAKQNR